MEGKRERQTKIQKRNSIKNSIRIYILATASLIWLWIFIEFCFFGCERDSCANRVLEVYHRCFFLRNEINEFHLLSEIKTEMKMVVNGIPSIVLYLDRSTFSVVAKPNKQLGVSTWLYRLYVWFGVDFTFSTFLESIQSKWAFERVFYSVQANFCNTDH